MNLFFCCGENYTHHTDAIEKGAIILILVKRKFVKKHHEQSQKINDKLGKI
jgi:hypothetical protein